MWQAVRENPRAVTYAVLMHVGLLLLLVVSLDWTPKSIKPGTTRPIQAELVDMSRLREIEAQKQAEQQRVAAEKRKLEQEKQRKVDAAKQQAEAERKQQAEQETRRKAEAERKQQAEQETKRKAQAERKLKAEQETKRKVDAERKQQAEQETKRKAEAERKRKAEEEAKRKAEAERKRKAEADAASQREAEQALQAQLAEEAALARAQSALSEFIPYIQEKVQNSWLRPAGSPRGLSCVIQVKLIPGGEVVDARVIQSSGDPLFDRSVETAVLKASPLPLPADPAMFKHFREINFKFIPD